MQIELTLNVTPKIAESIEAVASGKPSGKARPLAELFEVGCGVCGKAERFLAADIVDAHAFLRDAPGWVFVQLQHRGWCCRGCIISGEALRTDAEGVPA